MKDAEDLINLGLEYVTNGSFDEARTYFKEAIETDPGSAEPYLLLGYLYILEDNYKKSAQFLEYSISLEPNNGDAYYWLGIAYLEEKQFVAAEKNLKMAMEINPDNSDIYYRLGLSVGGQLELSEAIDYFDKYLEITDDLDEEKLMAIKTNLELLKKITRCFPDIGLA